MAYLGRIIIDASPETVFPFLHEPAQLRRWLTGFVESRPQTPGELRVGSRSIDVFEEGGRRIEMTTEITELVPGRTLGVMIDNQMMTARSRYSLHPDGARVVLELQMQARMKGLLKLLAPFLGGMLRRRNAADLQRLKDAVETGR